MKKFSIALAAFILFAIFQPADIFAVMPGDKIISFTSRTMSGETINIDSVIQKKPVLLFFWASW
jgi:hypothetical protein